MKDDSTLEEIKLTEYQITALRRTAAAGGSYLASISGQAIDALSRRTGYGFIERRAPEGKPQHGKKFFITELGKIYLAEYDASEVQKATEHGFRFNLSDAQLAALRYVESKPAGAYLNHFYRTTFIKLRDNNLIEPVKVENQLDTKWRLTELGSTYLNYINSRKGGR